MKRLAKIFAVVLVCVLAVTALVACGSNPVPNTNYDEAKKNLEDNDNYQVTGIKSGEAGFENGAAYAAAMVEGTKVEDMEAVLMAVTKDQKDSLQMAWFKTEDAAKAFHEGYKQIVDKAGDAAKDIILGVSGKVVYLGTKGAIEATK